MRRLSMMVVLAAALSAAIGQETQARLEDPTPATAVDVSPLTGRLTLGLEDLRAGGDTPWPLSLRRTYQPGWGDPANHGAAWVTLLDARLVPWKQGFVQLEPNGSLRFLAAQGDAWVTTQGAPAKLVRTSDGFRLSGLGRSLTFDSFGRLLQVAGKGHTLELERDAAGRVTAIAGPWGRVEAKRDEAGVLQALETADGRRVSYLRDDTGQLIEVQRPGVRQRFAYDGEGRLVSLGGELATVRYDDEGRVAELSVAGLAPTSFAYVEADGNTIQSTRTQGDRVERHAVGADLRTIRVERPEGTTVTELDARGRVVREVVDGVETTRSYDAQGRLVAISSPRGAYRFAFSSADAAQPNRVTAPHDSFLLTYDAEGRTTSLRSSAGAVRWVYDEAGRPLKVVTGVATLEVGYDARHRAVTAVLTQGQRRVESRVERSASVFGASTLTEGGSGRVKVVERKPDGSLELRERDAAGNALRTVRYDALGRALERTDARGVTRRFAYDALGRWVSLAGAAGERLRASYDLLGRLESLRDGNGNAAKLSSAEGWVTADEPAWGRRSTRWDGNTRQDRAGDVEISSTYNERGQLIARALPEGRETYRYDPEGKLIEAKGPDGGLRYAYDERGRLSRIAPIGLDAEVEYAYTEAGRVAQVRYPWGAVDYRYDEQGRLVALDMGARGTVELGYDELGRRTLVRYPSGVETRTRYAGDRIAEIRTIKRVPGEDEALLERRAYTYDDAGRVSRIDELEGAVALEHDAEGQLVRATGPDFARAFRYDAMGNRTQVERDGATLAAKVAAGNRLASLGEETLSYGARGALTQRGERAYRYDSLNRLVGATLADGSEVRYGYAPGGARLWREDASGRTWIVPGASGPAAEVGPDGRLQVGYLHGAGLDDVLGAVHGGDFFAAHTDCVKSVTALTDAEGRVAARYRYTPFGETVSAEGGEWNPLRYTGRPLDAATGLYDLRARCYAPELGRFTSPDPATHRGGANLYAYVMNDPSVLRDPLGLWPGGIDIPGPIDDFVGDRVEDAVDLGGDVIDAGGDALDAAGDGLGWVADHAPGALDWLYVSGPLGIDHNPFFFGGLPNPFALDETVSFYTGVGQALWGTVTSPITLVRNFVDDPAGTLRAMGELGILLNPVLAGPFLLFGPDEHAGTHLFDSFREGLGNYWDAFLNDPEEFWRRNGELAPAIVGLFLTGGESAIATLLLEINGILGYIGDFNTIIENAKPEEDDQGRYSVGTIPGTKFESLQQLAIGLVVAELADLQVSGHYTFSSELLDEDYDDFHEFVRAALELDEIKEQLEGDVDY